LRKTKKQKNKTHTSLSLKRLHGREAFGFRQEIFPVKSSKKRLSTSKNHTGQTLGFFEGEPGQQFGLRSFPLTVS